MNLNFCRLRRTKVVGILSCSMLAALVSMPVCFGQDDNHGDVVVRKNADGSISTYDAHDPAVSNSSARTGDTVQVGVHGANKPYTKKHSDGVVVRRNADGSIETYSPEEVSTFTPAPSRTYKKRKKKRRARKPKRRTQKKAVKKKSTVSKKPAHKSSKNLKPIKRGSLLK